MRKNLALVELRAATALMLAALAAFGSALLVEALFGAGAALPVLAVVVTLTLGRLQRGAERRHHLATLARLPFVAIGAGLVGALMRNEPPLGAALFVAGLSAAVWLRRFGVRGRQLGRLLTLPLIALLVAPVPATTLAGTPPWKVAVGAAVAALLAAGWVTVVQLTAQRVGWLPQPAPEPSAVLKAAAVPEPAAAPRPAAVAGPQRPVAGRGQAARKIPASTRMATQLAVALTAAFVIGHWISATHWVWVVLTAFIVSSGNRGRGDVVWKGLLRLMGAAVGTVLATLVGELFAPGDRAAIAVIFVLLWIAAWLRSFNYAYWAAGITAALAVLYRYYGEGGIDLLGERLGGILLGAAIAVASAWFVLPVRTSDVARRRTADALAALGDLLAELRTAPDGTRFFAALDGLGQLGAPIRAQRRFARGRPTHLADALDALERCAAPVRTLLGSGSESFETVPVRRELKAARVSIGAARRALAGRGDPPATPAPQPPTADVPPTVTPDLDPPRADDPTPATAALAAIGAEMSTVRAVWLAIPRRNSAAAGVASPPARPESGAAPA